MRAKVVSGDLLDQDVEVIVNTWNRNIIPWWLLLPQGVSGAIKRKGGLAPFRELARHGPIALGEAVWTGPGRLGYRGIIHVAGIDMLWRASPRSVRESVHSAIACARAHEVRALAFPVIGAGSGGFDVEAALAVMLEAFAELDGCGVDVRVVRFARRSQRLQKCVVG